MAETFYYEIVSDYRSGTKFFISKQTEDELENNMDNDNLYINLNIPNKKYISYIIGDGIGYNYIILNNEFEKIEDSKKFIIEFYSLINNMGPFKITRYDSSYKDESLYTKSENFTHNCIIEFDIESIYDTEKIFGVVINQKGKVEYKLMITPPG